MNKRMERLNRAVMNRVILKRASRKAVRNQRRKEGDDPNQGSRCRQKGFISAGFIMLLLVMMTVSLNLMALVNYASNRGEYDLNTLKAELLYENQLLETAVNVEPYELDPGSLPPGYFITRETEVKNGVAGIRFKLFYGRDEREATWVRPKE